MTTKLRATLVAWALVVVWCTMRPGVATDALPWHALGGGTLAGVDALANLILFAPAGWVLSKADLRLRSVLLAAVAASASVEFAQHWIPGRTAILGDVVLNVGGAALGWRMARPAAHRAWRRWGTHAAMASLMALHAANHQWRVDPDAVQVAPASEWVAGGDPGVRDCGYFAVPHLVCHVASAGDLPARATLVDPRGPIAMLRWEPADESDVDEEGSGCVRVRYTTLAAPLRVRPPSARYCDLAPLWEITLPLHPVLQRTRERSEAERVAYQWTRASVAEFLWPVWPFPGYRPNLLRCLGPLALVMVLLALGVRPRMGDALVFLVMLASTAGVAGLAGPGLFDLLTVAVAVAVGRLRSPAPSDQLPRDVHDARIGVA